MLNINLPDPDYVISTEETKDGHLLKIRINIHLAALYILENMDVLTVEETQEIMVLDEGSYVPGGEILIEQVLETAFGKYTSDKRPGQILLDLYTITEIMAKIRRRTAIKRSKFETLQAQLKSGGT